MPATTLMLALMLTVQPSARPTSTQLAAEAASLQSELVALRRDLHTHPELSNREERTAKVVADRLRRLGVPVRVGIARQGVLATIVGKVPGKTVLLRADMDALPIAETLDVPYRSQNPGVKHACGHDAHTAIAVGAAMVLWQHRDTLRGTVHVLFQPAEEGPPMGEQGGAPLFVSEGWLDKLAPNAAFALHVMPSREVGTVSFTPGAQMASADRFRISIAGKGTHGAAPHLGIDPVVVAAQTILALQTIASRRVDPVEPVVVTVGSVSAGTRFNIIPDAAELDGTLRTLSPAVREQSLKQIVQIAEGVSHANGATAKVSFDDGLPVLINHTELTGWAERSLVRELGESAVRRDPPRMIAEDFACIAEKVPSFYFFLGVGNAARGIVAGLHTAEFDIDEAALSVGVRALSALVVDYLGD